MAMSDLCNQCRHRRRADSQVRERLMGRGASPAEQEVINQQLNELAVELRGEDLAFERRGSSRLTRPPVRHDWCAAQSGQSEEPRRNYYFCEWLTANQCRFFQCAESVIGCPRCETGHGSCLKGAEREAPEGGTATGAPPVLDDRPTAQGWSLPLGAAFELQTVQQPLSAVGEGSFQLDYELKESDEQPAIRGAGLAQTYLLFGGPGAGKTYYFKYLLKSLLGHPDRPGCLLLDPKGVLTRWLREVLRGLGREEPTLLAPGADQSAFNVLGKDLRPAELGRLLSEVVLAGAGGGWEDWGVFINDLLEAAAVIIHADKGDLTAAELLDAILYRKSFTYQEGAKKGQRVWQYPIVVRAKAIAKRTSDADVRIAADRIDEYFSKLEPRQLRMVRQLIERSLGGLRSPEWKYLSSGGVGNDSVYSGIIRKGRVVSVAVGQSSPAFQGSLSMLVKSIFQQAVLADLSRRPANADTPFFILACDEYAQAITEGQTGLVSDSRFFSLSREAGCMSLLALQSVATGRSRFPAAMHDRWEGILGNVTVKFFMRLNDVETAQMASALAGSQHSFVPVVSQQDSAQGPSRTEGVTMVEHPRVPPWYLTNRMAQGSALVLGTLDGQSLPTSVFVKAPSEQ